MIVIALVAGGDVLVETDEATAEVPPRLAEKNSATSCDGI